MWQGVGPYDKGSGHMEVPGICGSGSHLWHKWGHVTGMSKGVRASGRLCCHVAGGGGMSQGLGAYDNVYKRA